MSAPPPPSAAAAARALVRMRMGRRARARARPPARARGRGISLILALVMLAVIAFASAAIGRNVASGAQVVGNAWLQAQAGQQARLALRFCERQLGLPAADRVVALAPAPAQSGAAPAWSVAANWSGQGPHPAHVLAAAQAGGPAPPRVPPRCLVEASGLADVYTVTARGFGADFRADPATGATRTGAVVWLQSTLVVQATAASSACAADCGVSVRRRFWQQLLTPPF